MRRGVPAKIFVPTVSSPAKISRIRDYGAELVVWPESSYPYPLPRDFRHDFPPGDPRRLGGRKRQPADPSIALAKTK